jgi:hypothetical protein
LPATKAAKEYTVDVILHSSYLFILSVYICPNGSVLYRSDVFKTDGECFRTFHSMGSRIMSALSGNSSVKTL